MKFITYVEYFLINFFLIKLHIRELDPNACLKLEEWRVRRIDKVVFSLCGEYIEKSDFWIQ